MNFELRNIESVFAEASPDRCRRVEAGLRGAFYPMYFGAVCLGKCLQTRRRVVYLTGQPGSEAGVEDG